MNYRFTRCFYGVVKKVHRTKNKIEKYNKFDFETFYKDFFGLKEKNMGSFPLRKFLESLLWLDSCPGFSSSKFKITKKQKFFFFFF